MGAPTRETLDYFEDLRMGSIPGWATGRKTKSGVREPNQFQNELGQLSEMEVLRSQKALGIKKVDSLNDIRQMRDWLSGEAGGGSGNSSQGEDSGGYPRNTGEFDDIIGALGDDVAAANARADEYANKATEDIANNTETLSDQFNAKLAELTAGFTERYGALEDLLATQQNSMSQFQTMMQGQMQAAQNSYNQQMSMMQNMQRSRVPEAEENAFSAQIGDQREDTSREKQNNRLSDLSILSGLGTQSSPTSGLSLA